jgi:hypothetical protein
LAWPLHHAVAGCSEDSVDRFRAETSLLRVVQQLGLGVVSLERRPVRARLARRLVGVGGGEDARGSPESPGRAFCDGDRRR